MTPEERANEVANTFLAKSRLPAESANEHSEPQYEAREEQQGFLRLRVRTVKKLLAPLDEHSGTGPDRLRGTDTQELRRRASFATDLAREEAFSCRTLAFLLPIRPIGRRGRGRKSNAWLADRAYVFCPRIGTQWMRSGHHTNSWE